MLITAAIAIAISGTQEPSAPQLVSKMLAYYNDAETIAGTISMVQRTGNKSAIIKTSLQYEKPSKIYLHQALQANYGANEWLVTSDGRNFSYDVPDGLEGRRLVEPCRQGSATLGVREIYQAVVRSLGDRSTPLDVVIGRPEDLRFRNGQWATLGDLGVTKLGDIDVRVVGGKWREYQKYANGRPVPPIGTYQMFIDAEGRLLRYVERALVGTKINGQTLTHDVETVWDVSITKNGQVRQDLFKLVR